MSANDYIKSRLQKRYDENRLEPLRKSVAEAVAQQNLPALLTQKKLIEERIFEGEGSSEELSIVNDAILAYYDNERRGSTN